MRSFNMGRFGNSDDPWFKVGTVDVNTTIFVIGIAVCSIFLWAIEGSGGPILDSLRFDPSRVVRGQVWRMFTWPIVNTLASIWTLIMLAVFFMLGSQLEAAMGRRMFTIYLIALTIIPSVVGTLFHLLTGASGSVEGLRLVELGVLVGFALRLPNARFWPGIPAWGIAAGIVGLNVLQLTAVRDRTGVALELLTLLVIVAVALVGLRSLGFADEAEWVPKVPLPASVTGMSAAPKPAKRSGPRRKKRGRANLSVAPAPTATPRREVSKVEEAQIDAILDQVSEHGMDSLSPQQRRQLEDHAERLRRRSE